MVSGDGAFDYWKALTDGGVSDEECMAVAGTEKMPQWICDNTFPDVEITTCKGKEVCVKAAKGVVMACGGNICEAFTSGMMCGQNVSALEAWG